MLKNTYKTVVVASSVVLLAGCAAPSDQVVSTLPTPSAINLPVGEVSTTPPNPQAVETTTASPIVDTLVSPPQAAEPRYIAYSPEVYAELNGTSPFVLFFHAPWCPTCRKMEQAINAELSTFPKGTTILKVDYDTETSLKKTWDIRTQSAIVVVNASGKSVFNALDPSMSKIKEAILESLQ